MRRSPREALGRGLAGTHAGGAALLAGARVAVQGAALDGLVDRLREGAVLGVGRRVVALADRGLEATEVGLDGRRVAAVLQALTLGPEDALLLRVNVRHERPSILAGRPSRRGAGEQPAARRTIRAQ